MSDEAGFLPRPSRRNTSAMIDAAASSFDAAHYHGIMALYATPMKERRVRVSATGAPIIDFVRCSYLGLDNHPAIVEGARRDDQRCPSLVLRPHALEFRNAGGS